LSVFSDLVFEAGLVARSVGEYFSGGGLRLGVTGLSRSGKTVFLTALVNNLIAGATLPVLAASAEGRLTRARLEPQPDDAVPRFAYEEHLTSLSGADRRWPQSTRRISQLRLTIEFESAAGWGGRSSSLSVDLVDYPGEWLLDLPLLDKTYAEWARETLRASETPVRAPLSADWRAALKGLDAHAEANEDTARDIAERFTAYLRRARDDVYALSTLPPGRFLMPGDLAGSPAFTFFPMETPDTAMVPRNSLWAMMERRYRAYKTHVIQPFYRDHFARLDRQIVLVDVLSVVNAGADAVADLERALSDILRCFRQGQAGWQSLIKGRRIDRIVFAATKADHLHHTSHDRLEAILQLIASKSIQRASFVGSDVRAFALASVRVTSEAEARQGNDRLPCIVGVPLKGERLGSRVFNGQEQLAIFPGDLPEDPALALSPEWLSNGPSAAHFVGFRPQKQTNLEFGQSAVLEHIRLDRALNFLIGDKLS